MITIPSQKNKKWIVSYLGDFFGHIINAFNIDLFSSQGRLGGGKKLKKQTTNSDIADLANVYGFTTASIKKGTAHDKKVWGITDNTVIKYDDSTEKFIKDTSSNLGDIDSGSDIISVKDDSQEALNSIQYLTTIGKEGVANFYLTGDSDNTKWAQSMKLSGPLDLVSVYLAKYGSPSDSIKIAIQEDDGGEPSGTDLTYVTKLGSSLTTAPTSYTFDKDDFSTSDITFTNDKTYWLVFTRTGSADTKNYYLVRIAQGGDDTSSPETDDPYVDGELKSYNGSSWERITQYIKTDTFTSSGTWTVPTGVTEALVECWGAGGGGTADTGAGGGGAYTRKTVTGLTAGDNISVVVGTSASDADGGDSTFDTSVVVAKGGKSGTNGGNGGDASSCVGDVSYSGGGGEAGTDTRYGGGSAGNAGSGGSGLYEANALGSGGEYNGGTGGSRIPGGGGNSSSSNGNAGARGEVRISYWTTAPADYPIIKGTSFYKDIRDTTTHHYTIPYAPDNVMPGELLLLLIGVDGDDNLSISEGWTELGSENGVFDRCALKAYYKYADGTSSDIDLSSTSANSVSFIVYRIWNADVPEISITKYPPSYHPDPPSLTLSNGSQKTLWFAIAANRGEDRPNFTAPPTGYGSMLFVPSGGEINSAGDGGGNNGACIVSSTKMAEASSEDPDCYGYSSVPYPVVATIGVPYKENTTYYDLSGQVNTEFPEEQERLYVTTTDDVQFLGEEDSQWYSLWQGALKQEALDSSYPRILKSWGIAETLFLANGNKVHSIAKNASMYTQLEYERIKVPPNYYANWMVTTKNAIFVGFANVDSDSLPSLVVYYEPYTEYTRSIKIPAGATMGFEKDENCSIIDIKGGISVWNGSYFKEVQYLPLHFGNTPITLPHRNGFAYFDGNVQMLWKAGYPYPSGIWTLGENIYHTASIENTFTMTDTGALYYDGTDIYIGGTYSDGSDTVKGIFIDNKTPSRGAWFVTARIPSPSIKDVWHDIALKYLVPKPSVSTGNFVVKYRTEQSPIPEGTNADIFNGTWTSGTTFTANDSSFTDYVSAGKIKEGNEVLIISGNGAGKLVHITNIDGTTITIDTDLGYTSGDFNFVIENWTKINFREFRNNSFSNIASLGDKRAEWIQFKVYLTGDYRLEEIQLSSVSDLQIDKT